MIPTRCLLRCWTVEAVRPESPFIDTRPQKAYGQWGKPIFGDSTTRPILAFVPVAAAMREPQVYAMGDKSPRSKDKTKKQGTSKKAKAKASREKSQASVLPVIKKT